MKVLRWAKTRVLKTDTVEMVFGPLVSNGRLRVGAFSKRVCRKDAFKHSYTVECGNCLRVGVRVKNASVSGFACRPF